MKQLELTKPAVSVVWFVIERGGAAQQQAKKSVTLEDLIAVSEVAKQCKGVLGRYPQEDEKPNWHIAEFAEKSGKKYQLELEDAWFKFFEDCWKDFSLSIFTGLGAPREADIVRSAAIEVGLAVKNPDPKKKGAAAAALPVPKKARRNGKARARA